MKARYLFPDDYMADLSVHVFNGRLYISPSHDIETGAVFDDDGGHFQMRDYQRSEGQVFDFFVKRSITCPRDLRGAVSGMPYLTSTFLPSMM